MTPAQQAAIEGLIGRQLTPSELTDIEPLLVTRNDVAIANLLSIGRKKLQVNKVGVGTIIAAFGSVGLSGGDFLDALVSAGTTNRNVHWAMVLIENSNFDLGDPAAQFQMTQLITSMPAFAPGLNVMKSLGYVANPINYNDLSRVLNIAEGRMVL